MEKVKVKFNKEEYKIYKLERRVGEM